MARYHSTVESRRSAAEMLGYLATFSHDRIDVLIHDAGAVHPEFRTDTAGTELTIVGQVVAPFLLTRLLGPALVAAAPSRLITVWAHLAAATATDTSKAGAGRAGQPYEVVDHQDGFELCRTWWPESSWTARLTRCESGRLAPPLRRTLRRRRHRRAEGRLAVGESSAQVAGSRASPSSAYRCPW